ncbi:MAG: superoxide dismutase [Myxococcaceae bacterium]|nr:MAG: superoxide dismutase [Myxococcaceae bacterium]
MNTIDRRDFGAVALGAAAATLLQGREADAQPRRPDAGTPLSPNPAEAAIAPLPFAPASLPGLSERMLVSHHDNNYGGAVRKLNEVRTPLASADPAQSGPYWSLYGSLKAAELAARNSAVLHELYFGNLAAGQSPPGPLATMVTHRYGSMDRFRAQMLGAAKAASGWVVLVADGASHTLEIVQTENHAMGGMERLAVARAGRLRARLRDRLRRQQAGLLRRLLAKRRLERRARAGHARAGARVEPPWPR